MCSLSQKWLVTRLTFLPCAIIFCTLNCTGVFWLDVKVFCRIENDLVLEPSLFHPGIHISMDNYLVSTSNKTVHFIITKSIILQFFFQHCFSASDKAFEEPPACQMASGKIESQLIPTLVANDWVSSEMKFFPYH